MDRKARRFKTLLYCCFLLFSIPSVLSAEEEWAGPVRVGDFSFDVLEFFLIGWSEQGYMAFGATFPAEGGGVTWQWSVQDLVDDKTLYTSPGWTLMTGQSPGELWALHPEWYSQLIRFGITTSEDMEKGEKIFRIDGVPYRLEAEMDRSETAENPEGVTREMVVRFFRNHTTAKVIYDYKPDPAEVVVDDMILKGYIRSPHEKRIAVVSLVKSGSEAASLSWHYRVFGAHLTLGFSPVETKGSQLAEAVLNGQLYVSRMFLENGADPDEKDPRGYTALLLAARRGLWDIVGMLLQAGADPNPADDRGRTPLHYAVAADAADITALLVEKGADPDKNDSTGLTPRQEAAVKNNPRITKLF